MRLDHVAFRLDQQLEHGRSLSKALDNLESAPLTRQRVDVRLQAIQEQWDEYQTYDRAISLAVSRLSSEDQLLIRDHSYYALKLFNTTRECFLETVAKMTALSDDLGNSSNRSSPTRPSSTRHASESQLPAIHYRSARLPRIDIPKFNGNLTDWLPFKDLFASLVVSNNSLSPVEKLQYLKTSLTGSAAPLLRNTALTSDNFEKAWDALLSFYENDRLLVTSAIQTLFSLKKMTRESSAEIEHLYTTVMQTVRTLETLHRPVQYWDDILVFIVTQRLDSESIKAWELHLGSARHPPTWKHLSEFLMTRMFSLRAYEKSASGPSHPPHSRPLRSHSVTATGATGCSRSCPLCHEPHYVPRCPKFLQLNSKQRNDVVKSNGLCFNCLGPHRIANCKSTKRCLKCGKRHHSSLHSASAKGAEPGISNRPFPATITPDVAPTAPSTEVTKTVLHAQLENPEAQSVVLLATAQVRALNRHRESVHARALLDPGSEVSLVTEALVHQLQISRISSRMRLVGVGQASTGKTRGTVRLALRPHFDSDTEVTITAHILPRLTTTLPCELVNAPSWPHLRNLKLADPQFLQPGKIDVLIGADVYGHLLEGPLIKGTPDSPVAQLSKFGWLISGPTTGSPIATTARTFHCSVDEELSELLERFWKLEEICGSANNSLSSSDQECEAHFERTHSRTQAGRYIVRMPFKANRDLLGDSRWSARRMLKNLERKSEQNPAFATAYSDFLLEYENLGHMLRIPDEEVDPPSVFYLPHHGVIRESSSTTKLRVVFNGSCAVTDGRPINDLLHTGPKLQTDIIDVILWFRKFRYMFCCDIQKMYRQIQVHPEDQPLQRILWHQQGKMVRYQLATVTYGLGCAPYLALRTILQLVEDEGHRFPQAIESLKRGRYVDDIYGGADTVEEAREQARQVDGLCMAGGFPLRKWMSNALDVLQPIPTGHRSHSDTVSIHDAAVHALGLMWNPASDQLSFVVTDSSSGRVTKRSVMSRIAQLFDPLGLLSPVIVTAKIFIQELWAIKISWDDSLPEPQRQSWDRIIDTMKDIPSIQIPRWTGILSSQPIQIHGFCDASQRAMAAVVYIRTERLPSGSHVSLLCAKTKVAPLKRMTIPRLELSSAVMLTRLVSHVSRVLNIQPSACYLWTDSTIALTWIRNHPSRWKDFVHNRTCYIQETLPHAKWEHIPGPENPADCASRGLSAASLREHPLWWTGPAWISQDAAFWPTATPAATSTSHLLEERSPADARSVNVVQRQQEWDLLYRYSSLIRLIRVTATCKRVLRRAQRLPNTSLHHALTPAELASAAALWIGISQRQHYSTELNLLQNQRELPRSSPLVKLCPLLDQAGLLRVRGRLQHANLDPDAKHPYILPKQSPFSTLVIRDAHEKTLHGSTQDTLSYLRSTYWIVGGRAPVRSYILKCVKCARYRRSHAHQLMGQLPPSRVNPTRAFLNSGIDYAGPYALKTWKGKGAARTYKAWIALFICLATSAVHLELVTEYSTEAFLAAYRRFTARRGICLTLQSDCGTNFVGANSQLRAMFSAATTEHLHLASTIAKDGTKWTFNPPAAPHFGGKWEAGVKRVKYHLRRVTGDTLLTYEEMSTVLTQIEAVLNSRPLCPLTDDPDDLEVLTPGHFLIGQPLNLVPEPNLTTIPANRLQRWQRLTKMTQDFWAKWSREYLQRFQSIYKWNRNAPPLAVGHLVLVTDERYPPAKWPLGRIIEVHPGPDNLIRVVTIRTATTSMQRPITKLCPLPMEAAT